MRGRVGVCGSGGGGQGAGAGGGHAEVMCVRGGGMDGATVAKGLRKRDAEAVYRDGVFDPTVDRLASIVRAPELAAVGISGWRVRWWVVGGGW